MKVHPVLRVILQIAATILLVYLAVVGLYVVASQQGKHSPNPCTNHEDFTAYYTRLGFAYSVGTFVFAALFGWVLRKRWWLVSFPMFLLMGMCAIGIYNAIVTQQRYSNQPKAFDQKEWLKDSYKPQQMVHYLVNNNTLNGQSLDETLDQLGEPYNNIDDTLVVYQTVAHSYFYIHLQSGKVTSTEFVCE